MILTVEQLADRWQRPPAWVRQHATQFGGFKLGHHWRFDLADVERYEQRRKPADPLAITPLSAKRRGIA